jgi:hypothetical protein
MMRLSNLFLLIVLFPISNSCSQEVDYLHISYNYINTIPQNAVVYLNNDYIGSTPVRFLNNLVDSTRTNVIKIKLKDYHEYTLTFIKTDLPLNKNIALVPVNKIVNSNDIVLKNQSNIFRKPRKIIPVALSSIVSGGAAVFSFYFKRLANDRYDEYINMGNRSKLDLTKKYDLYSGIGLGIFQVAFVSLLYFLLIE